MGVKYSRGAAERRSLELRLSDRNSTEALLPHLNKGIANNDMLNKGLGGGGGAVEVKVTSRQHFLSRECCTKERKVV